MEIERRGFLEKTITGFLGAVALLKGIKVFAKGLPSDPDAPVIVAGPDEIILPAFEKTDSFTLDKALVERKSSRNYDENGRLSKDQLSRLLWAADGVNRPDGHRTAPSALARYPIEIIAAIPEGTYRFEPEKHRLVKVIADDIRKEIPLQGGFKKAAMILLYINKKGKDAGDEETYPDIEIGCMVQNTYLEAASLGLGSCVFAIVRFENAAKLLGLKDKAHVRIAQAVGPLTD